MFTMIYRMVIWLLVKNQLNYVKSQVFPIVQGELTMFSWFAIPNCFILSVSPEQDPDDIPHFGSQW